MKIATILGKIHGFIRRTVNQRLIKSDTLTQIQIRHLLEWLAADFDPDVFRVTQANDQMRRMFEMFTNDA